VVNCGDDLQLCATPADCYVIDTMTVDGNSVQPVAGCYTVSDIRASHTVLVTFKRIQYTISVSGGPCGVIDPNGPIIVNCGDDPEICVAPDNCCEVHIWYLDGSSVQTGGDCYILRDIRANHTVRVTFKPIQYTIWASAGPGGSVDPNGAIIVNCGDDLQLCATPADCYEVDTWYVDGNSVQPVDGCYTLPNIRGNHTVLVTFKRIQYTISASAGPGGVIDPSGATIVNCGDDLQLCATPADCYVVDTWTVDGNSVQPVAGCYTLSDIRANHTVLVTFKDVLCSMTATAGPGGSIDPNGVVTVSCGSGPVPFCATPDSCYEVDTWYVDGNAVLAGANCQSVTCVPSRTVHVTFKPIQYTIWASAGPGGVIDPNGAIVVNCGDDLQLCATPADCYVIDTMTVDGNSIQPVDGCYTLSNIMGSHTVHVTFRLLQYTVTVPCAVPNGSINPCGEITVDCGDDLELCATPDACYEVDTWYVDGNSVQVGGACYMLSNIMSNHTVSVTFTLIQYTLTIDIVGCGSVTREPNKLTYDCNELVRLDANACPGWTFINSWSGDLTGANTPEYIFMDGDKYVTATFTRLGCGECDGQTYEWISAYPWSYLWVSPWNWDPLPPYGGPGIADTVVIGLDPVPAGPVLDTDIDVCRIYGPAQQATGDQKMYVIKDANVLVCKNWIVQETVPHTGTILIAEAAKVSIRSDDNYSFHAHGDDQRVVIDMNDNASMVMDCDMRAGNGALDYFELNMTDSTYMSIGSCAEGFRQNEGEIHVNVSGNAILEAEHVTHRMRTPALLCTWTVSENGHVVVTDGEWRFAGGGSNVVLDVLDNAVVDVNGRIRLAEDNSFEASCILNMSGQLIMCEDFKLVGDGSSSGWVTVNLTSGVIDSQEITYNNENWTVNICGDGVWVVDGDRVEETLEEAEDGHWVACPEEDCRGEVVARGTLMVDYNNVNPGRTTIWSEMDLDQPWSPIPTDGATDVPTQGTELCWCPPEVEGGIKMQHVFFSTDCEAVANRYPAAFLQQVDQDACVDVGCLEMCTTYCWAVDVQDHFTNIVRGPVWTFTTECCRMIEPFDEYTLDPWSLIYKSWKDGCGIWVGEELISNGTGSCVNLGMENTQDGPKAMIYTYENDFVSLWERDVNYSEACRE
ncbi:MAG: InlB B-repeat-containing protein, partial [Planctomycetota bacterium]